MTHWSSRLLADRLKISPSAIQRAWRSYGLKLQRPPRAHAERARPWKAESFRFSTDPELVGKVTDICWLYLGVDDDVPQSALVLYVDAKSHIQALDRTVPILPMHEGRIGHQSFVSRVIVAGESPCVEPRNCVNAGRSRPRTGRAGITAATPRPPAGTS